MGLIVTVNDEGEQNVVAEMYDGAEEMGEIIGEMITDPIKLDQFFPGLGLGKKGAAIALANKDEEPEFPIVRVEEGWSNNKRLWTGDVLTSIAEQVNATEPVAHLGHIKAEDMASSFPDPQTTWLGAIVKDELSTHTDRKGKTVKVAYFAGYNLPGAKVRTYIKSRAVRGVSWWGMGEETAIPGKGVQVKSYALKSLDWARKLAEGMPTSSIIGIASEMEDGAVEKTLASVTPEEFKKENPNGYALLVAEVTADKDATIAEMEEKVTAGEQVQSVMDKIRKALGIEEDADPLEAIAALAKKVGEEAESALAAALDKVLAKKVPDERTRATIKRLMPVGEMQAKVSDAKDAEEAEKVIGEMVEASFNDDEDVKALIGEQAPPVVRRREQLGGGSGEGAGAKDNHYATRERVTL